MTEADEARAELAALQARNEELAKAAGVENTLSTKYEIYLYEDGFEPPETGTYYLITRSGVYLHRETKAGNAMVKVNGIPWLKEPTIEFSLKLPKIPASIIGQALTFFRKVFKDHHSESYVTLFYSEQLKQYQLWCPKQTVTYASVNYDRNDQPPFKDRSDEGWQMCGTIHSHCDFSAYHSGTDIGDEDTFDGIHITLGHVNKAQFSMEVSISFNGIREKLEPENCCSGVLRVSNKDIVNRQFMTLGESSYFDLELTEADAQQLVADTTIIHTEWMEKVEHGFKSNFYQGGGTIGFNRGGGHWSGDEYHGGGSKKNDGNNGSNLKNGDVFEFGTAEWWNQGGNGVGY